MNSTAEVFSADLRRFVDAERWTFAKTMSQWPHEYLVRERVDGELFEDLVKHIRANGYDGHFYQKKITYYDEAGLMYWTMGAPLEETTIINRCRKEDSFEVRSAKGTLPTVMVRGWPVAGSLVSSIETFVAYPTGPSGPIAAGVLDIGRRFPGENLGEGGQIDSPAAIGDHSPNAPQPGGKHVSGCAINHAAGRDQGSEQRGRRTYGANGEPYDRRSSTEAVRGRLRPVRHA